MVSKKGDKIEFTEDRVKDMLKFAVEREYYEKAVILRNFLKSSIPNNQNTTIKLNSKRDEQRRIR